MMCDGFLQILQLLLTALPPSHTHFASADGQASLVRQ